MNYEHRHRFGELQRQIDWLMCPDQGVRDFISSCATDPTSGQSCTVADAEDILQRMHDYPHKMLYYPPLNQQAASDPDAARQEIMKFVRTLHPERLRRLKDFAAGYPITKNTRLLVMFMPFSRPKSLSANIHDRNEAERIAYEVRSYFLKELLPGSRSKTDSEMLQPLFPREVGCVERATTLKKYLAHPENLPLRGEPKEGQPRTVVWIFLLDCAAPETREVKR